jgi:hypothetical protein
VEKYMGVSPGFPLPSPSLLEMIMIKIGKCLGYDCKERCLRVVINYYVPFNTTSGM